jgi:hypothetical protein
MVFLQHTKEIAAGGCQKPCHMLRTSQSLVLLEAALGALYSEEGVVAQTAEESAQRLQRDSWSSIEETWGQCHRFKATLAIQFTVNRGTVMRHVAEASQPVAVVLLSRSGTTRLLLRDRRGQAMQVSVSDSSQSEQRGVGVFQYVRDSELSKIVEEHLDMDLGAYLIQRSVEGAGVAYNTLPAADLNFLDRNAGSLSESVQIAALAARCGRLEEALRQLTEQLHSSFLTNPRDVEDLEVIPSDGSDAEQDMCPVHIPPTLNPWRTTHKISLPRRIILVRHGESLGNADESVRELL